MIKELLKFIFRPLHRRYKKILLRISNLETALDYLLEDKEWHDSDKIGFNGQKNRKLIFLEIIENISFDAIIETGTWIGNTTGYMSKYSNLPVYTCDLNRRFQTIAKIRLNNIPDIKFVLGDSRNFLKNLLKEDLKNKKVFIYIDSHWYDDLPLLDELEIICQGWKKSVIMIDDFHVPDDERYGYDNYGGKKIINLAYISKILSKHKLISFFPRLNSEQETGDRRGCVILTFQGNLSEKIKKLKSVYKYDYL